MEDGALPKTNVGDLALLSDEATCGHLVTDPAGRIVRANRLFAEWCGRSVDSLEGGIRLSELLTPASRIFHSTHFLPLLAMQGFANEISFDLLVPGSASFPVLLNARSRPESAGSPASVAITVFPAGATRRHERALMAARREAETAAEALRAANVQLLDEKERLRITLHSMSDAVVATDEAGRITALNPMAVELLGVSEANAIGAPFEQLVALRWLSPDEARRSPARQCLDEQRAVRHSRDTVLVSADGGRRRVEDSASPIRAADGRLVGAVWVCRDVTERTLLAESLDRAVRHDKLTGLVNRDEFERALARLLQACGTAGPQHLLCHLDLDQFSLINAGVGHLAGDALLQQVGKLLAGAVRGADTVARLDGDKFAILLVGCALEPGEAIAEAIRAQIAALRFEWASSTHEITASLGMTQLTRDATSVSTVMSDAEMACHAAKHAGRNRVRFFGADDAVLESLRSEVHSVSSLRRALSEDRLELFFQPIVATASPRAPILRGEILLRLRDESGRLQSPGAFVPAAERFHQMAALDRWVIRKTFRWLAGVPGLQCSVNVSGQSLGDVTFREYVVEQLKEAQLDPAQVCFEITETAAIANLDLAREFIAALRGLGSKFALDDFGAGLSSFGYLRTLRVDTVKIDGSFVRAMHEDAQSHAIVESIYRVARISGLDTIAEWVENETILDALRAIGVDYAQGYGVGKPRPVADWAA